MRICLFTHAFLPWSMGGVEIYINELSKFLHKQGHYCWILTRGNKGLPREEKKEDFTIIRPFYVSPNIKFIASIWNFLIYSFFGIIKGVKLVKKENIDVINGHLIEWGGIQAAIVARLTKRPLVTTIHGDGLRHLKLNLRKKSIRLKLIDISQKIIIQLKRNYDLLRRLKIKEAKLALIPSFVSKERFQKQFKMGKDRPLNFLNRNDKIVIFIARLCAFRNPILFVNSAKFVLEEIPSVKFLITGDGDLFNDVKQQIERLGLDKSVFLLGIRKDVPKILKRADVYVATSSRENFTSVALFEAMFSKTPVVATNVGETNKLIKHLETGVLANDKDPKDIAEKIIFLIKEQEIAKRIAENGYKTVVEHFSLNVIGKKIQNVYYEALKNQ